MSNIGQCIDYAGIHNIKATARAAEDDLAELLKDRKRLEFITTFHDNYDTMINYLKGWARKDKETLGAGWYCWKVGDAYSKAGYIDWYYGPFDTANEAIDKALEANNV